MFDRLTLVAGYVIFRRLRPRSLKMRNPEGKRRTVVDGTESGRYSFVIHGGKEPETLELDTTGVPLRELSEWLTPRLDEVLPRLSGPSAPA